jgi:type II secretory pathway component PulF
MLKFKYKATGSKKEGIIFAPSKKKALALLINQGVASAEVTLLGKEKNSGSSELAKQLNAKVALPFLKRILQLHGAGMPIGDTLKILQTRLRDGRQKELAVGLWRALSEGKSLGEALKHYPRVFGEDIVYPIEAAEATGNLTSVLREVIRLLTERAQLKKKVLSGMAYPLFVSVVAVVVVGFFLFFLLPRIEHMLKALGGEMSMPARLLISFSHELVYGLPLGLILIFLGAGLIKFWRKHSQVARLKLDRLLLYIPVLGSLVRYVEICRISNVLSTLLSSGVNLTEGMRLTEKAIHNLCLRQIYQEARSKINDGVALSVAFRSKTTPFFTDLAFDILMVGESTGNMHESLQEVYRLHNEELDSRLRLLTNCITSGALAFAFFLVGILALGIVSSVMQFSSSLKL